MASLAFESIVAAVEPLLGCFAQTHTLFPSVDPRTDSMATPSITCTSSFFPDTTTPMCCAVGRFGMVVPSFAPL